MSARSDAAPAPTRRERRGFALPLAILALALMTAALIAAFTATSGEVIANSAMRAQDHAYQLAEAGLEQFMVRRGESGFCTNCVTDPTTADSEWTRVSLPGGYATVVATRVRPKLSDAAPALFFIRSTGVDTLVKLSGAGRDVRATRTVGEYASFGTSIVKPMAALTSLNGVTNSASKFSLPGNGIDECFKAGVIAGFVVPRGGQYTGTGNPPFGFPPVDSSMTLDSLKQRVGIDWNAIVNTNAIPADITIPGSSFPTAGTFNSDTSYWPVIHVKTNFTIPNDGRGIIIADSNLVFDKNNAWEGIVLVGGSLTAVKTDSTEGLTITGLNRILPNAVNPADGVSSDNDLVGNTKRFKYNSCKVSRAAARLQVYFAWPNTWMDNVAVW